MGFLPKLGVSPPPKKWENPQTWMVNIMEKTLFKMEVRCFILDTKNQWMESLEAPLQRFVSFFNKADASFGFRTSICSNAQKKGGEP